MSRIIIIGILVLACCQPEKKTRTDPPAQVPAPVATLAQMTAAINDSVRVVLARPAKNLAVYWGGQPVPFTPLPPGGLAVKAAARKTGWHTLVVGGVGTDGKAFSDTLAVELRSNLIPAKRAYTVLATYPHQTGSFTQGLEFYRGQLYESTGLNGQSRLMQVDLKTGMPLKSTALPAQHFGEGITVVNGRIYQLTWTSGLCFRYNMDLALETTLPYYQQGWGLAHRDSTLILSDGTNRLFFYTTGFRKTGEQAVYDNQGPVANLNELEYVDGYVFCNVWQTNRIAQVELASGRVVAYLDMTSVVPPGIDSKENVLNGIAYEPREQAMYVTGKNWPVMVKIRVQSLDKPAL